MRAALLALALLVGGCGIIGPDWDISQRRPMSVVPDQYAVDYADVEACLGMAGDFHAIHWFVATRIQRNGREIAGYVDWPHDITIRSDMVGAMRVVRHEMVHHIMRAGNEIHDANDHVPCESWWGVVS